MMTKSTSRCFSLDVFRGLTIALMVLVNNQYIGEAFAQLRHSAWDGCTLTDVVFPFFVFIVGASFFFVAKKRNFKMDSDFILKIFFRCLKIFAVGLFLNWYASFSNIAELRILGVLQRIAIVFFLGAILLLALKTRIKIDIAIIVILLAYWILLITLGNTTLEGNIVRTIDLAILGESHMYANYGIPFDPEGLLSTMPTIATMMLGYRSSLLMNREDIEQSVKIKKMFWAGLWFVFIASLFSEFLPINKPIWSSTYVILTAGWAMIIWIVISVLTDDMQQIKWTTPFVSMGSNAIVAYALATMMVKPIYEIEIGGLSTAQWFKNLLLHTCPDKIITLLWGIFLVTCIALLVYPLYKRKIFIKL